MDKKLIYILIFLILCICAMGYNTTIFNNECKKVNFKVFKTNDTYDIFNSKCTFNSKYWSCDCVKGNTSIVLGSLLAQHIEGEYYSDWKNNQDNSLFMRKFYYDTTEQPKTFFNIFTQITTSKFNYMILIVVVIASLFLFGVIKFIKYLWNKEENKID